MSKNGAAQTSCLIILIAFSLLSSEAAFSCGIATTLEHPRCEKGMLRDACASKKYKYIDYAVILRRDVDCTFISDEVRFCQNLGVKVLLSYNNGKEQLSSPEDARGVAYRLWNAFLGGSDSSRTSRPMGDASLDGISFDFTPGSPMYWDEVAEALKELSSSWERKLYLSASPQCHYPDPVLGPAIETGLFDYVSLYFFAPECKISVPRVVAAFNLWSSSLRAVGGSQLLLSLSMRSDWQYVPPRVVVEEILPEIRKASKYGGVMLWNQREDLKTNYSSIISGAVCSREELLLISQVV